MRNSDRERAERLADGLANAGARIALDQDKIYALRQEINELNEALSSTEWELECAREELEAVKKELKELKKRFNVK